MPLALAQDAIALLIDLAEQGEIDPWDVKVIDVIDRFLSELAPFDSNGREPYEANLSQSGQAFLYASMLLLLKADSIAQADQIEAEADSIEEIELEAAGLSEAPLPPHLERQLRRRAVARPPQRRRVTLKELIDQLQAIASALEDSTPRKRLHRPRNQSRKQAIRAIAQLAHQENLSEMAVALEQFLADHRSTLAPEQEWMEFDLLLELWLQVKDCLPTHAQISTKDDSDASLRHERVGIFWALLLLSAQSKVELSQEEFYQDLKIRVLSEQIASDLAAGSSGALAD